MTHTASTRSHFRGSECEVLPTFPGRKMEEVNTELGEGVRREWGNPSTRPSHPSPAGRKEVAPPDRARSEQGCPAWGTPLGGLGKVTSQGTRLCEVSRA